MRAAHASRWILAGTQICTLTSLVATQGCGDEDPAAPNELDAEAIAGIRHVAAQGLADGVATGVSVAIWRDGEVIYAEGFGTKDEAGRPVTADTVFQIGSDTKKLTAIAVLQQVDDGAVSLHETAGELIYGLELAQSPGHLDTVSLHELLSHQSGLWDYTPWSDDPRDRALDSIAYGRFAANEYAMMPAGLAWIYSNPDYSLAGLLIEQLERRRWPEVIIEDVAAPLGMTRTFARRDDALAHTTDIASSFSPVYSTDFDTFDLLEKTAIELAPPAWTRPQQLPDNAFLRPSGLMWSTAPDMARLGGFLVEGDPEVLSEASRAALVRAHVATRPAVDPDDDGYGYGLYVRRGLPGPGASVYDVPVWSHGGATLWMSSTFVVLPEQRVAVSILANSARDDWSALQAAALEAAAAERLPEPGPSPVPQPPPRDDFSSYAGTFEERALGQVTLTVDGDDLRIEIPALDALDFGYEPVLRPITRDVFALTLQAGEVELAFYDGEVPLEYGVTRWFVLRRVTAP